jgi:hydrogenase nickel incorporation protein HypA/HybF
VHEQRLIRDVVREIEQTARAEGATRVLAIGVRLGALSHFTEEHFREHFDDASRGTLAEGASVRAELATDTTDAAAQGVVLETVELELPG